MYMYTSDMQEKPALSLDHFMCSVVTPKVDLGGPEAVLANRSASLFNHITPLSSPLLSPSAFLVEQSFPLVFQSAQR